MLGNKSDSQLLKEALGAASTGSFQGHRNSVTLSHCWGLHLTRWPGRQQTGPGSPKWHPTSCMEGLWGHMWQYGSVLKPGQVTWHVHSAVLGLAATTKAR